MRKTLLLAIVTILVITLPACSIFRTPTPTPDPKGILAADGVASALNLTVQAQNAVYNLVGQSVPYTYVVKNNGTVALTGTLTLVDDKVGVNCPLINTVGNNDNNLDAQESLTCASNYVITQADLNTGAVTSNAVAKLGGVDSNKVTTTVPITLNKVLTLTMSANPASYSQAGQTITFTYTVKNTGTTVLGPTQFVVSVDRLGAINCLANNSIIAPNESVVCSSTYTTTANDVAVNQLAFNGIANGGGAGTAQATNVNVPNTNVPSTPGTNSSNLTKGSTIQHKVEQGEWMLQIARCYGADFNAVRNANLQIQDPAKIKPDTMLTIPNIGSNGNIYGKPCIEYYTVQAGDTWNSIAQKRNADLDVLMEANPGVTLATGIKVRVPLNSANGNPVPASNEPIRLNFPNGSGNVTLSGNIAQQNKIRYVLNAAQGQALNIKLTAPVNEVAMSVSASNTSALKALDATQTWSGTIPATGDYFIDIFSQTTASKTYTLEVALSALPSAFERVADINSGGGDSNPAYMAVFNNAMYFRATGSNNVGAELWKYDPGLKAASFVKDINPGAPGSDPAFLTNYNGALYFSANNNDGTGVELFRFNGNDTGRLGDTNPGAGGSNPAHMAVFNNFLYFSANGNDNTGVELWRTDGTAINRVADIHTGTGDSNPSYLTVFNNALYFSATSNDGTGTELWKYDGTNAPSRVADINNGVGNSNPSYLAVFNNILYFSANGNDSTGTELWKYDGTNAPSRVADINPGTGDSGPTFLTVFNGALYFSATGDATGTELWMYDGANAKRVSDLNKSGNSNPAFLAVFDNALFFQANGGDGAGVELWKFKGQ